MPTRATKGKGVTTCKSADPEKTPQRKTDQAELRGARKQQRWVRGFANRLTRGSRLIGGAGIGGALLPKSREKGSSSTH